MRKKLLIILVGSILVLAACDSKKDEELEDEVMTEDTDNVETETTDQEQDNVEEIEVNFSTSTFMVNDTILTVNGESDLEEGVEVTVGIGNMQDDYLEVPVGVGNTNYLEEKTLTKSDGSFELEVDVSSFALSDYTVVVGFFAVANTGIAAETYGDTGQFIKEGKNVYKTNMATNVAEYFHLKIDKDIDLTKVSLEDLDNISEDIQQEIGQ